LAYLELLDKLAKIIASIALATVGALLGYIGLLLW